MSLRTLSSIIGAAGGIGGLGVVAKYLLEALLDRKRRKADTEVVHVDADAKRVQMADTIIQQLKEQVDRQGGEIKDLQQKYNTEVRERQRVEALLYRKIALLERTLILNGIELPYED